MKKALLCPTIAPDSLEMRQVYVETLVEMAGKNPKIVLLEADLMDAIGTRPFQKAFPDRCIDCGIMEANMVGVAAGLSAVGFVPFAHSFGVFVSRRALDQVFLSAAYAGLNVKLVGSDPGVTAATNGGTHMPLEDCGLLRGIPNISLVEPTDTVMLRWLLPLLAETYGNFYIRMPRKTCAKIFEPGQKFSLDQALLLREGKDVTLIASGVCVSEALAAADLLAAEGVSARVLNVFVWRPIDEDAIIRSAKETGAVVTCENHRITNGLGSAVAEVLVKNHPAVQEMIGVGADEFGEVGSQDYLTRRFHLTAQDICLAAKRAIKRKKDLAS